jgi:hypothetical protein
LSSGFLNNGFAEPDEGPNERPLAGAVDVVGLDSSAGFVKVIAGKEVAEGAGAIAGFAASLPLAAFLTRSRAWASMSCFSHFV